jgi:hypothetical protein
VRLGQWLEYRPVRTGVVQGSVLRPNGGLIIGALRHRSQQGPLQSIIQNVKKWGLLEEFWGPFEYFCMGRRGFLIPVRLCLDL